MFANTCTDDEIVFYKKNGYSVAKHILPEQLFEVVHGEIAKILFEQIMYLDNKHKIELHASSVFDLMKALFELSQIRYLACLRLIARLYSMQMLMMHPKILAYTKAFGIELPVMQSRTVFHAMSNQLKFVNGYFGFDVHQDWPSLQSSLDMVTVWVPLVDVDVNLFPLEVIPGSHLKGLCRGDVHEHISKVDPSEYRESDFVRLEAERGDVIFMTGFSLHRSGTSGRDNDVRLAASCRYENAMEKHVIEHAYPYCQNNIINRQLIVNNFPTCEQVQEIFST